MKKSFVQIVSVVLAVIMIFPAAGLAAENKEYVIVSPYADVVWEGDGAWEAYKGNLHTHSFVSDANVDYRDMILEYYRQGFDFLAMTDHGVTGKEWNKEPTKLPLYAYQGIIGNKINFFSDEEYAALTSGAYPADETGAPRGNGMTCVTGGNELNALTLTKSHVNAIFLPDGVGNNHLGFENDFEGAVKLADKAGAVSFINHPGDWIGSGSNRALSSDPEKIKYFSDILLRYDSCLGMEVFNERNVPTHYDRDLWDNLLMACLPYGKNVMGFSNSDAHVLENVDSSFSVFMMEENTVENIRKTMNTGAFFAVTRKMGADPVLGPANDMDVRNSGLPYPMFSKVTVDGHKISVTADEYYNIQWVADGRVIAEQNVEQSADSSVYTLDLDKIDGAENFTYVRCQLLGEGGITLTQAFAIDDGGEPQVYQKDTSAKARFEVFWRKLFSMRIFVILKELWQRITGLF